MATEAQQSPPITLVFMVWQGARGYTMAHASAVATAVARHATFPYRVVVLTDRPAHSTAQYTTMPLPEEAQAFSAADVTMAHDYPKNIAKLWLFSKEAACLGKRICYLDADSLVIKDLAPLVTYAQESPFVGMRYREAHKLCTAMFCLDTGSMPEIWEGWLQHPDSEVTDQGWLRHHQLSLRYPCWDNTALGIYMLQDLAHVGGKSRLPADARIVHPTGKTKPGHPRFLERHPWSKEYYPWPR